MFIIVSKNLNIYKKPSIVKTHSKKTELHGLKGTAIEEAF